MEKSLLVRLALLLMTLFTLAGCLLVPVDDGYDGRGHHERHHEEHHGEEHDRR